MPDRETINSMKGYQTEAWVTGWNEGRNCYYLDRNNYERESDKKYNENEYQASICHELCHAYFGIIAETNKHYPIWLSEVVSVYLSGQLESRKAPQKFEKFLEYYDHGGADVYTESGYVIKLLVDKFGKEKLITLIESLKSINSKESFDQKFSEIFGLTPSYDGFNVLIDNTGDSK